MIIISPNEVFGDIMVLASPLPPPPRPPVDPDYVNARNSKNIQRISLKLYMRVVLLTFDTLLGLEQLCLQPNDTRIPQIFKMQYLHK